MYCPMEVPPLALLCLQRPDMGLSNEPAKLFVIKVRGKREIMSSYKYAVPLLDMKAKNVCFQIYGRDKILIEVHIKNLSNIKCLFQWLTGSDIICSAGELDILNGFECAGDYPVREQSSDHLFVLRNRFYCSTGGSHTLLQENKKMLSNMSSSFTLIKFALRIFMRQKQWVCCALLNVRVAVMEEYTVGCKPYT